MKKTSIKVIENKTKGEKLKIFCSTCKNETNHLVIQSIAHDGTSVIGYLDDKEISYAWFKIFQIIQCQGCDFVSFRKHSWCSENEEYIYYSDDHKVQVDDGTETIIYPKRTKEIIQIDNLLNIPVKIRRIFLETIDCFNSDAFILCAAGLRATIEGVCDNLSIVDGTIINSNGQVCRKNNLQGKISGLHEKGFLTENTANTLHEHRYLGNQALHELSKPSSSELSLAIYIVKHILESIYEFPEKAIDLQTRREERSKKD